MPRAEEEAVRQDRELIRVSPALRYFAVGPRHNAGTQWSAAAAGAAMHGHTDTKFEFVINLKAAKQIGLTLSPEFLSRANKVIK